MHLLELLQFSGQCVDLVTHHLGLHLSIATPEGALVQAAHDFNKSSDNVVAPLEGDREKMLHISCRPQRVEDVEVQVRGPVEKMLELAM